ncbi:hypothetical protein AMAG_02627 [Allomyces macrogynus ATCC 38327]|uniref:NAD-dependent epimerase/dehydratase domain-containing protein n=1 Tax=Allomyces macrogynus (strain ATCC 38327) TaxID=578462 RepID=A0A0L0S361_ALLM3|nr:hypothetical protein AMAG_02627 [Allomyces macrogynus ATCC 38327]|eukprot:KNE56855.1 hypothetical protein AMAG_02627 [Allomyces macrogynus ATCC 38327]
MVVSIVTFLYVATVSGLASTPVVPLLVAAVLTFAAFVLLGMTASVVPTSAPGDYLAVIRPAARDPCADLSFTRKEPIPVVNATTALVTGGSGFIGSHLVEKLLALGYKVRILDNLATGYLHNIAHLVTHANVEFVYGDIMDQDTILQAVQGVDYVYHLAAMSKVAPSMKDPAMARFCLDTNVGGTVNVLNASRIAGVKKVVYAASSTYYGNGKVPMNEVDPPNLLTPYSATKYEGEIQMDLYDRIFNLPTIAVRFFMVYGPRQPTTGAYAIVTGVFLKKWMDHQPLPIEGDGSHYRDFIHARDITKALILAQQSPHRAMVVNAGTGVGHSVHEVADLVSPDHTHVAPRRNDLVGTLADTCKAKKVLGFEADYEFTHEMTGLIHDAADPKAYLAKPEVQNTVNAHLAHPWLLPPGLLTAKYAPLVNDLPALASVQARDMQLTVIPYHASSRPLLENAVYSLVKHGQAPHFLVAAEDAGSLTSCLAMNLPCYNATSEGAQWVLPRVTSALLDLGYTVHAASIDASYVRAVWPSYTAWLDSADAEMAGQYEPTGSVSAANYLVRPTEPARAFFRTLLTTSGSPARAFATAFKAHASLCQSRTSCAAVTRSGKLAVRDFSSIHGRSAPCAGGAVIDVCTRATAAFIDPACANGVAGKAHKLAKLGAWFMREVCPAGAGDDPALRKHECMGVPAALLSRRSAGLPDAKATPAVVENECMGKVAALTAQ